MSDRLADDLIVGTARIGEEIGRTRRQAQHLIDSRSRPLCSAASGRRGAALYVPASKNSRTPARGLERDVTAHPARRQSRRTRAPRRRLQRGPAAVRAPCFVVDIHPLRCSIVSDSASLRELVQDRVAEVRDDG